MNKRLSFVASVFLASFALGIAGAGIAYANSDDGDDGEFRWLAAAGLVEFGQLCELTPPSVRMPLQQSRWGWAT